MPKKARVVGLVALAAGTAVVVLLVIGIIGIATPMRGCADQLKVDEAKVRTTRWEDPGDLPALGQYLTIHWQAKALGDPCSRMPGPTDWMYQGIVHLRPSDARSLASGYDWQDLASSAAPEPQVWPALAPFVPANAHWLHSDTYDNAEPQSRWRHLYLDPERAIALFVLNDH